MYPEFYNDKKASSKSKEDTEQCDDKDNALEMIN
jgi:hypothetical protein